mmetsp:Transcript_15048/g.19910  ORF Transcript_15048/g.19910 Transcript_15048/m.19910 type:complete len:85 (+) Transcript_15048:91-345(+)
MEHLLENDRKEEEEEMIAEAIAVKRRRLSVASVVVIWLNLVQNINDSRILGQKKVFKRKDWEDHVSEVGETIFRKMYRPASSKF